MASFQKNLIVSEVIKSKSEISSDDEPKKKSRENWRKAKELEEARKAGTAPAAVDEEGKDINPHIPQYISSTPWYYGARGPTLKHQRIQPDNVPKYAGIDDCYKRGVNEQSVAKKWRKGACENCGAMGHKRKDCLDRPRKRLAMYSNSQIAPDDIIQPVLNHTYDGKRDHWAGYDPSHHLKASVERFKQIEEAKQQLRAEKLNNSLENKEGEDDKDEDEAANSEEDEDKYVDDFDMPGTKVDSKQRITVRNLRIREDTAKYLRNLDPSSAFYDPKTRSMRDNPYKGKNPEEVDYAGENFVRFTGDTRAHGSAQLFAWEAYEKGVDVHLLAEPTKLELLKKEYEKKKDEFKHHIQKEILEKYGGEEHLEQPPKELLLGQTEEYKEYTRYGKIVKGEEKRKVLSKYQEDVYPGNHTSVWGSYWSNGEWGYKCCHSLVKNSYCTGEAGKEASTLPVPSTSTIPKLEEKLPKESNLSNSTSTSSDSSSSSSSSDSSSSSSDSEEDKKVKKKKSKTSKQKSKKTKKSRKSKGLSKKKLEEALVKEETKSEYEELDDRKRKYNSMYEVKKPTEEEMEAYYMKRKRDFDPLDNL